jgi:hypothetical protein
LLAVLGNVDTASGALQYLSRHALIHRVVFHEENARVELQTSARIATLRGSWSLRTRGISREGEPKVEAAAATLPAFHTQLTTHEADEFPTDRQA